MGMSFTISFQKTQRVIDRKRTERGCVTVKNGSVHPSSESDKPFVFELNCCGKSGEEEFIVLAAPTEEDMIKWVRALGAVTRCDVGWLKTKISSPGS